ncbi:STAS domain-containing protein [Micromonospora sp. CPCC 206061]|uniref:STAS domain-containing protein n=1 Tax=Micromonospora sp. CPCC 206061 TaxID=3122410 RepID=UPI002FF1EE4D
MPLLTCRVEVRGNAVHLIASGRLDGTTGKDFELAVRSVLTGLPHLLVLDLTEIEGFSTEGAAALGDAVGLASMARVSVFVLPSRAVLRQLDSHGE